jgi:hypothetical protein
MSVTEQLAFPFASLDFAGRSSIPLWEMAKKLGVSTDHLLNEVEHGALVGLNLKGHTASRRNVVVPIESYRAYVLARMTGPFRRDFIRDLPGHIRRELRREMIGGSDKAELREMLAEIKEALQS